MHMFERIHKLSVFVEASFLVNKSYIFLGIPIGIFSYQKLKTKFTLTFKKNNRIIKMRRNFLKNINKNILIITITKGFLLTICVIMFLKYLYL